MPHPFPAPPDTSCRMRSNFASLPRNADMEPTAFGFGARGAQTSIRFWPAADHPTLLASLSPVSRLVRPTDSIRSGRSSTHSSTSLSRFHGVSPTGRRLVRRQGRLPRPAGRAVLVLSRSGKFARTRLAAVLKPRVSSLHEVRDSSMQACRMGRCSHGEHNRHGTRAGTDGGTVWPLAPRFGQNWSSLPCRLLLVRILDLQN